MLITDENIDQVLGLLSPKALLSLDTETTGLRPYHGDRPFSVIVNDGLESFYFPILQVQGLGESKALGVPSLGKLRDFLQNAPRTYFLQNAKFDMGQLFQAGYYFHDESKILDTMVLGRILQSDNPSYSLDFLSQHYLRHQKDDRVKDYIDEYKLYTFSSVEGLSKKLKNMHFDQVPLELIQAYGELDAKLTYDLGVELTKRLSIIDENSPIEWPSIHSVIENEALLTRTCFEMERIGVRLDKEYCKEAISKESKRMQDAMLAFQKETGRVYKASGKAFEEAFGNIGITSPEVTDKGSPKFDYNVLTSIKSAASWAALEVKDAKSRLNFFNGYLFQADINGFLHTNFRQSGTATGRFSSSDPNLQNLTTPEAGELTSVRRAIVPFNDNFCLVMFDYKTQEYRMMLDYAQQQDMVEKILAGADVHQATADLVRISRTQAKTLNFALLYGAGSGKISGMLGLEEGQAKELISKFFAALPKVRALIYGIREAAKRRKFIFNWFGRRCHYSNPSFSYAAPNHLIQGGCADVIKIAMNKCHKLLEGKKSKMSLVIHDELVFNIHISEKHLVPEIKNIMLSSYPYRSIPMEVEIYSSYLSLADKEKWAD